MGQALSLGQLTGSSISGLSSGSSILSTIGRGLPLIGLAPAGLDLASMASQYMPDLIPGYDINWGNILPGGEPFITAEPPGGNSMWPKTWYANGTQFRLSWNGTHGACLRKNGTWKTWRIYRPTVFGKKVDANKFAHLAKKYNKTYKELNKLFGKRVVHEHKGRRC
jgi:hypothetical protein